MLLVGWSLRLPKGWVKLTGACHNQGPRNMHPLLFPIFWESEPKLVLNCAFFAWIFSVVHPLILRVCYDPDSRKFNFKLTDIVSSDMQHCLDVLVVKMTLSLNSWFQIRKKFDLENFSMRGLRSKFQMMGANHKHMTQIHLKKSNFLVSWKFMENQRVQLGFLKIEGCNRACCACSNGGPGTYLFPNLNSVPEFS